MGVWNDGKQYQKTLLNINRIPKMISGMPIGAAKSERVSRSPTAVKRNPRRAAMRRPVNFKTKLKRAQTMTNGKSNIGVLLRCVSTDVLLLFRENVTTN